MKDFRSLQVWEKAHRLALDIYKATQDFLSEERYGLISQLRRAAASIPTNIAEGCGRGSDRELAQFIQIAVGSASEVEYLLELSRDLEYLSLEIYEKLQNQIVEIRKILISFLQSVRKQR